MVEEALEAAVVDLVEALAGLVVEALEGPAGLADLVAEEVPEVAGDNNDLPWLGSSPVFPVRPASFPDHSSSLSRRLALRS